MFNLSPMEKLIRARVQLNNTHPFFARMTMALKFVEMPEVGTMGVNRFGVCYFNPDFVDKLTPNQLKGVLAHEVMHCALDHIPRGEKKKHMMYNVAGDLVINDMLNSNSLELCDGALMPDHNHSFDLQLPDGNTHKIEDINKRTADSIYDEINSVWKDNNKDGQGGQGQQGEGQMPQGHDKHKYGDKNGKDKNNKGVGHRDSDYWKNKTVESHMASKMAGKEARGMERIVDKIVNPVMSWQQMLQKFVRNRVPFDFTWRKPNKKTYSTGWYLPNTVKEGVTITLLIDTSGSVSQEDINQIFGELKGLVGQIRGLQLRVLYHDTQVYEGSTMMNPTLADVLKEFKNVKGGGGTNFEVAYQYVEDLKDDVDMVIHATDGFDRFPEKFKLPIIILLVGSRTKSKEDVQRECKYAKVVKVPRPKDFIKGN